jgi:hypothetical protein
VFSAILFLNAAWLLVSLSLSRPPKLYTCVTGHFEIYSNQVTRPFNSVKKSTLWIEEAFEFENVAGCFFFFLIVFMFFNYFDIKNKFLKN